MDSFDALLLVQAVYETGTTNWKKVSGIMKGHAVLKKKGTAKDFSQDTCKTRFEELAKGEGLDVSTERKAHDADLLKLAKKHYADRIAFLRQSMQQHEAAFNQVCAEIEEIKTGQWDDRIGQSA